VCFNEKSVKIENSVLFLSALCCCCFEAIFREN